MSDDIFIKHGLGAFQQPYIGRASVNAQEPIISQRDARTPGNARQPGTYQHRSPGTYQLPASAQTPFIRSRQTPNIRAQQEPNIRSAQEPNIRSQQEPNIRDNQAVITYQHRTPTIYQNSYQHQQPSTYQHQSPSISQSPRNYQVPSTYQHRSPDTYPVIARRPVIYQHRSPAITTYRHPTTANVQSTYQVTSQKQNPFNRSYQVPYTFSFRSPFIQGYQTPYSHQQPATGFLPVTTTEFVSRASELITGFGTGNGIPNDVNSVSFRQQGASSILGTDVGTESTSDGSGAAGSASAGFEFRVQYTNTNDVQILVKEAGTINGTNYTPSNSRVGNMSSTSSGSFSYTSSDIGTSSFYELFKLTNIGANRAQVKVNYKDPTSSPYSLNTTQWNGATRHYTSNGPQFNDAGLTAGDCKCTPITWPRTTFGTTNNVGGDINGEYTVDKFDLAAPSGTTGITTSYANLATHGLLIGFNAFAETTNEGSSANENGCSTIIEFVVKDLDTNVEHTCDLLLVFAVEANASCDNNEEEEGE